MIILAGTVGINPDHVEALKPHALKVLEATRAEPGCIAYTFAMDLEEPGLIRVFEKWRSRADLDAHFKTPHMAEWRAALAGLDIRSRDLVTYQAEDGVAI
jgi:quinol monooxygenase YgiN